MRMKVGVCAPGMIAVSVSGCASGSATFKSAVDLKKAPSVARMFVLANMKSSAFNQTLYQGFERGLSATAFKVL